MTAEAEQSRAEKKMSFQDDVVNSDATTPVDPVPQAAGRVLFDLLSKVEMLGEDTGSTESLSGFFSDEDVRQCFQVNRRLEVETGDPDTVTTMMSWSAPRDCALSDGVESLARFWLQYVKDSYCEAAFPPQESFGMRRAWAFSYAKSMLMTGTILHQASLARLLKVHRCSLPVPGCVSWFVKTLHECWKFGLSQERLIALLQLGLVSLGYRLWNVLPHLITEEGKKHLPSDFEVIHVLLDAVVNEAEQWLHLTDVTPESELSQEGEFVAHEALRDVALSLNAWNPPMDPEFWTGPMVESFKAQLGELRRNLRIAMIRAKNEYKVPTDSAQPKQETQGFDMGSQPKESLRPYPTFDSTEEVKQSSRRHPEAAAARRTLDQVNTPSSESGSMTTEHFPMPPSATALFQQLDIFKQLTAALETANNLAQANLSQSQSQTNQPQPSNPFLQSGPGSIPVLPAQAWSTTGAVASHQGSHQASMSSRAGSCPPALPQQSSVLPEQLPHRASSDVGAAERPSRQYQYPQNTPYDLPVTPHTTRDFRGYHSRRPVLPLQDQVVDPAPQQLPPSPNAPGVSPGLDPSNPSNAYRAPGLYDHWDEYFQRAMQNSSRRRRNAPCAEGAENQDPQRSFGSAAGGDQVDPVDSSDSDILPVASGSDSDHQPTRTRRRSSQVFNAQGARSAPEDVVDRVSEGVGSQERDLQQGSRKIRIQTVNPTPAPEKFDGSENHDESREWLNHFEMFARSSGWSRSDRCDFVKMYLIKAARNWRTQLSKADRRDWKSFKHLFIEEFCTPRDTAIDQYLDRRQRRHETAKQFWWGLNALASKARVPTQRPKEVARHVNRFLKGLRDQDVRRSLWGHEFRHVKDVTSLLNRLEEQLEEDELVEPAPRKSRAKEKAYLSRLIDRSPSPPLRPSTKTKRVYLCDSSDDETDDDVLRAADVYRVQGQGPQQNHHRSPSGPSDRRPGSSSQEPRREVPVCDSCGRQGHYAKDCWSQLVCTECGAKGHPGDLCYRRCDACGKVHDRGTCPGKPALDFLEKMREMCKKGKDESSLTAELKQYLNC